MVSNQQFIFASLEICTLKCVNILIRLSNFKEIGFFGFKDF